MKLGWVSFVVFLFLAGCGTQDRAQTDVITAAAPAANPEVGFAIIRVDDESVELAQAGNTPFIPASTAKLITAVSGLGTLTLETRFRTRVCSTVPPDPDGHLRGDLVLVGGGDPAFDLENLLSLVEKTVDLQVTRVDGDFLYDDSLLPAFGWIEPEQPLNAVYNPGLSALSVAENAVRRETRSPGESWLVPPGSDRIVQDSARYGPGASPWLPVSDPSRRTSDLFRTYAARFGLNLRAPRRAAAGCPHQIAEHLSPPLSSVIRIVLEKSSNPMAELLGLATVRARRGVTDTLQSAADDTHRWLAQRFSDIDWTGLRLTNHSGLSSRARVTPRQMARLLVKSYRDQRIGLRPSDLTPAGWEGHLRRRLTGRDTATLVWAKTGTMHFGIGLAGFMLAGDGILRSFAIYATDREKRTSYDSQFKAMGPSGMADIDDRAERWDDAARALIDEKVADWMALFSSR